MNPELTDRETGVSELWPAAELRPARRQCANGRAALMLLTLMCGCNGSVAQQTEIPEKHVVEFACEIVSDYTHDSTALTEGLCFARGTVFESTGGYGTSSVSCRRLSDRRTELLPLSKSFWGGGLTLWRNQLIQLARDERVAFVYDCHDLRPLRKVEMPLTGRGLTTDGEFLIVSDGSHYLYFVTASDLRKSHRVRITDRGRDVDGIGELEYARGEVWAIVSGGERVACIDPSTGSVTAWLSLAKLNRRKPPFDPDECASGIAFDSESNRLLVTGRRWRQIFEIRLVRQD